MYINKIHIYLYREHKKVNKIKCKSFKFKHILYIINIINGKKHLIFPHLNRHVNK